NRSSAPNAASASVEAFRRRTTPISDSKLMAPPRFFSIDRMAFDPCRAGTDQVHVAYRIAWDQSAGKSEALQSVSGPARGPVWVLCHEHHRSKWRCATVREMKEGPSGSAVRC